MPISHPLIKGADPQKSGIVKRMANELKSRGQFIACRSFCVPTWETERGQAKITKRTC